MPTVSSWAGTANTTAAGGSLSWSTIGNATGANNSTNAYCLNNFGPAATSHRLILTNYSFNLAADTDVTQVTVNLYRSKSGTGSVAHSNTRLVLSGHFDLLLANSGDWTGTLQTWNLTAGTDFAATPTGTNWNPLEVWVQASIAQMGQANVDAVQVTLTYTTGGGGGAASSPFRSIQPLVSRFTFLVDFGSARGARRAVMNLADPPPPPPQVLTFPRHVRCESIPPDWPEW